MQYSTFCFIIYDFFIIFHGRFYCYDTSHSFFLLHFFIFIHFQSCPMCSETFTDAAALVAHFETSHSSDGRGSGIRNRGGGGTGGGAGGGGGKGGSDCALS